MKKPGIFVSIALVLTLVLGACSSNQTSSKSEGKGESAKKSGKPYIAIISKGFSQQYWQAVKKGADQAAAKYNVRITFDGPDNESQVDQQVNMLHNALNKNPDAIGFAALDTKAAMSYLQQAKSRNIPIIAFDSGVEGNIPVTTAATNNKAAGALAADKLAELIGKKGEVAVVAHDQTSKTGVDRRDGFVNEIKKKYPKIKIVDIQYGDSDILKSTDAAKAIMQSHPKLKGFYGTNENSAIGIDNAISETGKKGITVVGFDAGKQQLDAIKNGIEAGAITQNPIGIGYATVEAAVKVLKGQKVPKTIDTGFYWYDKSNMDSKKIKPLLYQ